jgi:hypothetical protein
MLGPPHPPFYQPYPPAASLGSSANNITTSPSDDDEHIEYPTITDFFGDLMDTESYRHNFTEYTNTFNQQGYYRVDELADESVTSEHLVKIIPNLKDGTARVIKKRVAEKVKQVRKAKARK